MGYRCVRVNDSGKEVYRFTKDDLDIVTIALTAENVSLKRHLELEKRCTNTRLMEVIGE